MSKLSIEQIADQEYGVKVGEVYRHYTGSYYQVLAVTCPHNMGTNNDKLLVVYKNQATEETFVRPITDFFTNLATWENGKIVSKQRFTPLDALI